MRNLDIWLAKTLFQPPIILICHMAHITQYAFYRFAWWAVAATAIWQMKSAFWMWQLLIFFIAGLKILKGGVAANEPIRGEAGWRYFFLFVALVAVLLAISAKSFLLAQSVAILFAEYALTIHTIPPRRTKSVAPRTK
jgi:hypothetical protein